MKKQTFHLPYIGIDDSQEYAVIYTDSGDGSIVIGLENPVVQYSADQDGYYDFHNMMTNIIKLLGAGYIVQKQDIFSKKTYSKF